MKLLKSRSIVILVSITIALLNGCAITEHYKNYLNETTEVYEKTEDLNANTGATGLLLVDAVSHKIGNTLSLTGVEIVDIQKPNSNLLRASFNTGFLPVNSGVVVIKDLQPGTYRINKLKLWNVYMWEIVYLPKTSEYEVIVVADEPTYFGQINIRHPFGTADREFSLKYDKAREAEAWEKVLSKYKNSSWTNSIQANLGSDGTN